MAIRLGQPLPNEPKTLNMYVNDSILLGLAPEQPLVYSANAFGTADAIGFFDPVLRVHDLKTGRSPVHMDQLLVYAAYFCLEYMHRPEDLTMELRIYQGNGIKVHQPNHTEIRPIMDKIVHFDKLITQWRMEEAA